MVGKLYNIIEKKQRFSPGKRKGSYPLLGGGINEALDTIFFQLVAGYVLGSAHAALWTIRIARIAVLNNKLTWQSSLEQRFHLGEYDDAVASPRFTPV